ncbi:RHS repeat-associated core domain-containing protein [Curtobacterium sp. 1P10AnD]|uniref:beta strand repeat-containing protein n=1 Tax=Curtobacterium sp. 1P10AnD TaxID=3132283 RepID=UPI0039A172A8
MEADTSGILYLDVQGYYTTTGGGAGVAPGGFVPLPGTRIVDTRNGTGAAQATIPSGGSLTVQVGGQGGVASTASAVAANIIVVNGSSTAGYVTPYPAGGTKPSESLHYVAGSGIATSNTVQVALSSSGQVTIANTGGTVNIVIDVQGYFAATTVGGSFTPASGAGLHDSRASGNTTPTAGSTTVITADGVAGVPGLGHGVSAVALQLTAINSGSSGGNAEMWADGAAKPPTTSINFSGNDIRSNTIIVAVGTNGKIDLYTSSTTDYQVLVEGWYNALPTGPSTTNLTGSRSSATNLSFPVDDRTSAQVDVATGNLLLSTNALTMTGVTSSVAIGAAYNSRGTETASTVAPDANKWAYALDGAGSLSNNANGVVYTGPDGSTWQFTAGAGGTFTAPAGLDATLVQTSGGYKLTSWTSNQVVHFNLAGQPTSVIDRYSNEVDLNYNNYLLSTVVTNAGPSAARTASVAYSNGTTTISQTDGTNTRTVSWSKNSSGNITSFVDADGKTTTFTYSGTDLTSVTAPDGGKTTFTYNGSDQVTEVDQPTATSATAATRFSYVSSTETQVASPNTDSTQSVASVAHTDYTLDPSTHDVLSAVDPDGNTRSASYNPDNNAAASTTAGSGSESTTTNGTWSGNTATSKKVSLTQVQSTSGASGSQTTGPAATATYANSGAAAYLPSQTTDGDGNTTKISYDTQGGISGSSVNGSGGSGPSSASQATLTRNTNGTLKSATSPGNQAANLSTQYGYDANSQLKTVTPPTIAANTGTQLGTKTYTYDGYGRMASESDGNGHTTSYTYDDDDRQLTESFSDGTTTVTNTYDGNGNELTSASAGGTITNTYDPVGHLTSTQNSAGGSTISYTYDRVGNELTSTNGAGTVTYAYDAANVLWAMTYPHGSGTETDRYKIDSQSRLTDAYTAAGANASNTTNATNTQPTSFQGHIHTTYDQGTGRESEVVASTGQDANKVFDTTYSYTTASGASSNQLQSATDTLTGKVTHYGYVDSNGNSTTRLTGVTQTGGTDDVNWAYTYDADGNRTAATESGAATFNQALSYNVNDQIDSAGYSYDAAGNMTAAPGATYAYNGAEQLTSETLNGTTTNYTYAGAAQDQLLTATTGSTTTSYTYGQSGIDTFTSNGSTSRVLANPSGQVLDLTDANGDTAAFVVDGIGNQVGALTDTGSNAFTVSYDPYGTGDVTTGSTSPFWTQKPFGFKVGARASQTQNAIVRFGLRWYLPTTGTWTQRDTLDAPLDPNNADRYAYAGDDPTNGSDPAGNSYTSYGLDLCLDVCLGPSLDVSDDGGPWGFSTSVGAGEGFSVGTAEHSGEVERGAETDFECELGNYGLGYSSSGGWSVGEQSDYSEEVKCSLERDLTATF